MAAKLLLYLLSAAILNVNARECNTREFEYGIVCVCNSTYCDDVPELEELPFGSFQLYTTSESQPGLNSRTGEFSSVQQPSISTVVIGETRYQTIIGFGGAFTDATGVNIRSLSEGTQQNLLDSYFAQNGIEYSLCRVPIGGTDFSPRPYSYDDVDSEDINLEHFELQEEDLNYKIPFIQAALNRTSTLKLFGSAWSAPLWMKTHKLWSGYSSLKEEYYQAWADYAIKFFDEYEKYDIAFWGMTTGNEPLNGFFPHENSLINALGWIPHLQVHNIHNNMGVLWVNWTKWIKENLGPTLRNSSHKNVKIMIHDDSRLTLPHVVPLMLNDEDALEYIDGVAEHWYRDSEVPIEAFDLAKSDKKEIFLLSTESCIFKQGLELGSWERGARYIESIIEYLEHDCVGWVDWNMALNLTGGPTYIGYESDGALLVNAEADEFYKQPMFYVMGHFSKFVPSGSVRLEVSINTSESDDLRSVAFLRPDDLVAVIFYNKGSDSAAVQIENGYGLYSEAITFVGNSLTTVLFPINDSRQKSGISENQKQV